MTWLLKNWQLVAGALLLAAIAIGIGYYGHTRYEAGKYDAEQTYSASIAAATQAAREKEAGDRAAAEQAEREQLGRVRELEARVAQLVHAQPAIRLCQSAGSSVPSNAYAAASADASAKQRGSSVQDGTNTLSTGPDISGDLVHYARDAEACRQQLIGLQDWVSTRFP